MTTLFELEDFSETRTEWRLVPDWDLCGLCGVRTTWNQGGTTTAGAVCDGCAQVDRCRLVEGEPSRWVSHWGMSHRLEDHDELIAAQARRRGMYLMRKAPISETGAER